MKLKYCWCYECGTRNNSNKYLLEWIDNVYCSECHEETTQYRDKDTVIEILEGDIEQDTKALAKINGTKESS